jgi:hypothetical protein
MRENGIRFNEYRRMDPLLSPTQSSRLRIITMLDSFRSGTDLWQKKPVKVEAGRIEVTVEDRNVAVIRLQ